ncbi:MAG: hypothetical protein H6707_10540 [Deltaproteobacteria bacterium]|nr:hypothetical protein [Deltaproteobacteria bacterium]
MRRPNNYIYLTALVLAAPLSCHRIFPYSAESADAQPAGDQRVPGEQILFDGELDSRAIADAAPGKDAGPSKDAAPGKDAAPADAAIADGQTQSDQGACQPPPIMLVSANTCGAGQLAAGVDVSCNQGFTGLWVPQPPFEDRWNIGCGGNTTPNRVHCVPAASGARWVRAQGSGGTIAASVCPTGEWILGGACSCDLTTDLVAGYAIYGFGNNHWSWLCRCSGSSGSHFAAALCWPTACGASQFIGESGGPSADCPPTAPRLVSVGCATSGGKITAVQLDVANQRATCQGSNVIAVQALCLP